jgi:hypothetical protein
VAPSFTALDGLTGALPCPSFYGYIGPNILEVIAWNHYRAAQTFNEH